MSSDQVQERKKNEGILDRNNGEHRSMKKILSNEQRKRRQLVQGYIDILQGNSLHVNQSITTFSSHSIDLHSTNTW